MDTKTHATAGDQVDTLIANLEQLAKARLQPDPYATDTQKLKERIEALEEILEGLGADLEDALGAKDALYEALENLTIYIDSEGLALNTDDANSLLRLYERKS